MNMTRDMTEDQLQSDGSHPDSAPRAQGPTQNPPSNLRSHRPFGLSSTYPHRKFFLPNHLALLTTPPSPAAIQATSSPSSPHLPSTPNPAIPTVSPTRALPTRQGLSIPPLDAKHLQRIYWLLLPSGHAWCTLLRAEDPNRTHVSSPRSPPASLSLSLAWPPCSQGLGT